MSFSVKKIKHRVSFWKKLRSRRILAPFFTVLVFVVLGGILSFALLAAWVSRDLPDPNNLLERNVALSTKIYDRSGEHLLYEIHGNESRTLIKLEDLPPYVAHATIAIEDKNFFQHHGVAVLSIARAAIFNVLGDTISRVVLRRPSGAGGASTITQQLVKNAILSPEQTFTRKVREVVLSLEIERRLSKEQILQLLRQVRGRSFAF
ncbi:MAG: transglycosylase domain-containing protein [bacterium]|nr:transglycosylase domain-containing protein [bacterium]